MSVVKLPLLTCKGCINSHPLPFWYIVLVPMLHSYFTVHNFKCFITFWILCGLLNASPRQIFSWTPIMSVTITLSEQIRLELLEEVKKLAPVALESLCLKCIQDEEVLNCD